MYLIQVIISALNCIPSVKQLQEICNQNLIKNILTFITPDLDYCIGQSFY